MRCSRPKTVSRSVIRRLAFSALEVEQFRRHADVLKRRERLEQVVRLEDESRVCGEP